MPIDAGPALKTKKKILFISRWFPYPTDNGSRLRIYNLLRGLTGSYDIHLISFIDRDLPANDLQKIESLCHTVQTVPFKPYNPSSLKSRLGRLSLTPSSIIDTYSPEMALCIKKSIELQKPDLVIASQLGSAVYRQAFKDVPAIYEEVELGLLLANYKNSTGLLKRFYRRLTWEKHRRYVGNLVRQYQACTVVSQEEKEILTAIAPGCPAIEIIPNCVNTADYSAILETPIPDTLIFTGSFNYYPNYQGMTWFLDAVYPFVQAAVPQVSLTITGDHGNLPLPQKSNVTLTGYVADVRPYIAKSWISIVPLLSGGGSRLKVIEAMALHTPVAATRKGSQGINIKEGVHLLVADDPVSLANVIIKLLREPALRQRIAENAFQLVRDTYDWSVVLPQIKNIIEKVALN